MTKYVDDTGHVKKFSSLKTGDFFEVNSDKYVKLPGVNAALKLTSGATAHIGSSVIVNHYKEVVFKL